MKQLFLTLDDAVDVAVRKFDADPELAEIEFEQKCYISNDQYSIGFKDGLQKAIEAILKEDE